MGAECQGVTMLGKRTGIHLRRKGEPTKEGVHIEKHHFDKQYGFLLLQPACKWRHQCHILKEAWCRPLITQHTWRDTTSLAYLLVLQSLNMDLTYRWWESCADTCNYCLWLFTTSGWHSSRPVEMWQYSQSCLYGSGIFCSIGVLRSPTEHTAGTLLPCEEWMSSSGLWT